MHKNMISKNRYKPFYKQFLRLRKNVQDRPKLFKFRKQKWSKFQQYSKNQLKFFKRFKVKDQFQISVSKFASRGNSFQKTFRNNLHERKIFSLFYGKLKKKYLKGHISKNIKRKNLQVGSKDFRYNTLAFFEKRLDIVLYRAKFSLSVKSAGQLILHGHILVNTYCVRTKSYILKNNDVVEVAKTTKSRKLVLKSLDRSNFWPIPQKNVLINYRTLQILVFYENSSNLMPIFNHYLNINSIIANIKKY